MASATTIKTVTATAVTYNPGITPFQVGNHIKAESIAGATLYGVNSPAHSDETKYSAFKQTVSGNKAFVLPSASNAPQNTTGGALSLANQLRVVGIVAGAAKFRARGDEVAPALGFVVAAGGGTAAGEAGIVADGAQAAGLTTLTIKDDGANTETILVGDTLTVGDYTYYCTETSQALNGTTGVAVSITPPLQVAVADAAAVTIAAAGGETVIFAEAPAVGATVEIWVMDSGDVITVTGGALTAEIPYDIESYNAFVCGTNTVQIMPLAKA